MFSELPEHFKFDESDPIFLRWLNALGKEVQPQHVEIRIVDKKILCRCSKRPALLAVGRTRSLLQGHFDLNIFVGENELSPRLYSTMGGSHLNPHGTNSMLTIQQMRSQWAIANESTLSMIEGIRLIYSTNRDRGYEHLAILPDKFGEKRLNKSSVEATLGKPLLDLEPSVALPRQRAIETVIETGEVTEYYYEHFWNKVQLPFRFQVKAQKLNDSEVLIVVPDHPEFQVGQHWFWQNYQG
jgi:hypothetical protein